MGELSTSDGGRMATMTVKNFFKDVYQGEPVRRTNGIHLEDEYKGQGLGQMLQLFHMKHFPNTWFYNSQSWPDYTNTLKTLSKKGLIELHWQREPEFGEDGGVHMSRLTPQGSQLAMTANRPKGDDPESEEPKPAIVQRAPQLPGAAADPHL